eukprot:m.309003 g.309003  ORF g.309003 m.309003 type:complete len:235 (+) comp45244_c0_seq1:862-1566(+)
MFPVVMSCLEFHLPTSVFLLCYPGACIVYSRMFNMAHKGSALLTSIAGSNRRDRSESSFGSSSLPTSPHSPKFELSSSSDSSSSKDEEMDETQSAAENASLPAAVEDRWDVISESDAMDVTSKKPMSARLAGLVNHQDVKSVLELQSNMLDKFEKANAQLDRFNEFSLARFHETQEQFRGYTKTLSKMKRDLNSVFRRIKDLKQKMAIQLPSKLLHPAEDSIDRKDSLDSVDEQ